MKSNNVAFSNEQCEGLEDFCKVWHKDAPAFIREALICLLPLSKYAETKQNLIELTDRFEVD